MSLDGGAPVRATTSNPRRIVESDRTLACRSVRFVVTEEGMA